VKHDNNFDLLRLFAALQVIYTHTIGHLHAPGRPGIVFDVIYSLTGVAIFFVISGFLVTDSYLRSQTIGIFFGKRALRIYPALIVNLIVIELAVYIAGGTKALGPIEYIQFFFVYAITAASEWAIFLTGVFPWTPGWGRFGAYPSQVLWTLTVEISFYVALPLALLPPSRWMKTAFVAALAFCSYRIGEKFSPLTVPAHPFISISTLPYFWIFALGILARLNWDLIARMFHGTMLFWAVAYAIATYLLPDPVDGTILYFIHATPAVATRMFFLAGLVLSAAFTFPVSSKLLRGHDLSYSLYLYHMLVVQSLVALHFKGQWWLWLVVIAGSVALATMSWLLVERPAMRLKPKSQRNERFPSSWTAPASTEFIAALSPSPGARPPS
jgi:peptidoglycan/LPS O-acetylase OafA/YrhL